MDMIKVMCDGYFNYPNPYIEKVTCPEDWLGLTPLGEDHPYIANQVLRAKRVVEGAKGECCVFYNVFCPMSLMRFGTSEELLMSHLKANPEAVCHAFRVIAEDIKTLVRKLITEAGCAGIYYCVQNAETFRFTEEEYRRLVHPALLRLGGRSQPDRSMAGLSRKDRELGRLCGKPFPGGGQEVFRRTLCHGRL